MKIKQTMSPEHRKFSYIYALYFLFIGMLLTGLIFELYFIINNRRLLPEMEEHKKETVRIYPDKPDMDVSETLWDIPWERYRPNSQFKGKVGEKPFTVNINSHGFRTKEFKAEKPSDVFRIICIGGSTTFQGNTNEMTYPAILERKLQKRYPDVNIEVLNFGISGTKSGFWIDKLDDLFKYQPDLIIQYNAVNDISWNYLYGKHSCVDKTVHFLRKTLNYSFLIQKIFPLEPSFLDDCFMTTLNNFSTIRSQANARGIQYIVGSFAAPRYNKASDIFKHYLDYVVTRNWGSGLNLKYYTYYYNLINRYNAAFQSYVIQNDFNTAPLYESISNPALFTDVAHMKPKGIEMMANIIAESVYKVLDKELPAKEVSSD